jgi:competence protein ComEC
VNTLAITVIDVGWGDSILVESEDAKGTYYALIDSNDTTSARSSYLFLKRFFERKRKDISRPNFTFEFVMLTHNHADHASGLSRIIRDFGARRFLYSNSNPHSLLANILRYVNRPNARLLHPQAIDDSTDVTRIPFGHVSLDILWPPHGVVDANENNNSIVLSLTLGEVTFILTGDATADVWQNIVPKLPASTRVFQIPHHGARNGTFDGAGETPWLSHFRRRRRVVQAVISSHIRPHQHPHPDVVTALNASVKPIIHYRTDLHYHVRFETGGKNVTVSYSHV